MTNSINTNIAALYAQANITTASQSSSSSVARLSSGNRIVQASDDVSALAIGTSIGTVVSALKTAQINATQGSSLLQVADGGLAQIQSILQTMQSVAQQAQSGSLTDTDRGFLNQEFQTLANEIDALAKDTSFNGVNLLDGSIATGGSTSSNPLQNTALVATTSTITPSGFTDVHDKATAGTTYQTGAAALGGHFTAAGTTITQPFGTYDQSLYGTLNSTGSFVTHANGAIGAMTGYVVDYTQADGTVYQGTLTASTDGSVAAAATLTLTATTNPSTHATLSFTVDGTGYTATTDNSATLSANLSTNLGTLKYTSGSFNAAPTTYTQPTGGDADPALHGDLSQGSFTVQLGTDATHTSAASAAKGYIVSYTLNGTTYTGFLANDGTSGHLGIAAAQTVILSSGANATNMQITLTVNTAFGSAATETTQDQSANIKSALVANFQGATALNSTNSASVTGEAAQAGIGLVSATSDPTKNDNYFVGDLSKGVFTVTGSAAGGYSVSYALNGSTYQGSLSAYEVTNGGTLVLDNGTGSLAFSISAAATNTVDSSTFQTALTAQFAAATAHASHKVATALESNGAGGTIPGSAITSTATAGTLLDGFNGGKATLTSSLYDGGGTNLPPISNFTATGTGTSTVFTVNIGGKSYSTQGTITADTNSTIAGSTFDGSAGVLNFYLNGDKTTNPHEVLSLNLSTISSSAKFATSDEITSFVDALNTQFGGGGSSGTGGLSFQLGATTTSSVTINIGSAKTSALFNGVSLDVSTANDAATAATAVTAALNTITSLRSGVGALETRFNFASAAIQSSVQNEGAAQSSLLDTDIAAESTNFATQQVKLQAGISVLAQANQQLQALLKLIA